MQTAVQEKQRDSAFSDDAPVIFTESLLNRYVDSLKNSNLQPQTIVAWKNG